MADLFNLADARQARDTGLRLVAENNSTYLWFARQKAVEIAKCLGTVCIDDVLKLLPKPDHVNSNALGGIFRDKRFEIVGYKQSHRVSNHGRRVAIWRLKDA